MSDQERISPYNIKQTSDENLKKYELGGLLVDSIPNSPNTCLKIVMQTVRRITDLILGIKRLIQQLQMWLDVFLEIKSRWRKSAETRIEVSSAT